MGTWRGPAMSLFHWAESELLSSTNTCPRCLCFLPRRSKHGWDEKMVCVVRRNICDTYKLSVRVSLSQTAILLCLPFFTYQSYVFYRLSPSVFYRPFSDWAGQFHLLQLSRKLSGDKRYKFLLDRFFSPSQEHQYTAWIISVSAL